MRPVENDSAAEALTFVPSQVEWATSEFVRSPPPRAILAIPYASFVALVLGIIGSYFLEVPVTITATGLLKPATNPVSVMAKSNAKITELLVRENQPVKAGQPLFRTDQEIDSKNRGRLRDFLGVHSKFLQRVKSGKCNLACALTHKKFTDANTSSMFKVSSTVKDLIDQATFAMIEVTEAVEKKDKIRSALGEQYRQISSATAQLEKLRKTKTADILGPKVEQLTAQIGSARAVIAERNADLTAAIDRSAAKAEVVIKRLTPDIEEYQDLHEYRSPIDGYIWKLNISTPGQDIFSGLELLQIIPESSELVAHLAVKNEDISMVAQGMKAALDLKALPEKEFETLNASVEQVSPVAEAPKGQEGAIPDGAKYLITARLEKQEFTKNGTVYKFRNGMELNGRIVTREERLLVLGFKKLLKLTDKFESR